MQNNGNYVDEIQLIICTHVTIVMNILLLLLLRILFIITFHVGVNRFMRTLFLHFKSLHQHSHSHSSDLQQSKSFNIMMLNIL